MSFTKRFIEHNEYNDTLISVLQHLDENDLLPNNLIKGIARKVIDVQSPEELSTRSQRWHFYNDVKPFIENIRCENNDCNSHIGTDILEESFNYKNQYGKLLCIDCRLNKDRENHYLNK